MPAQLDIQFEDMCSAHPDSSPTPIWNCKYSYVYLNLNRNDGLEAHLLVDLCFRSEPHFCQC